MKVKILVSMVGPTMDWQHGQVVEVSDERGEAMIAGRIAERIAPVVERTIAKKKGVETR